MKLNINKLKDYTNSYSPVNVNSKYTTGTKSLTFDFPSDSSGKELRSRIKVEVERTKNILLNRIEKMGLPVYSIEDLNNYKFKIHIDSISERDFIPKLFQPKPKYRFYAELPDDKLIQFFKSDQKLMSIIKIIVVQRDVYPYLLDYYADTLPKGEYFFCIDDNDTAKFNQILSNSNLVETFPFNFTFLSEFVISNFPEKDKSLRKFRAIKSTPILIEESIIDIASTWDRKTNKPIALLKLNPVATQLVNRLREGQQKNRLIFLDNDIIHPILFDDVYPASLNQAPIPDDVFIISKFDSPDDIRLLKILLSEPEIKIPINILEIEGEERFIRKY